MVRNYSPETKKVIHNGSSPSKNALTHHEHDKLSPEFPDKKDKSLHQESNGDTKKALNDEDSNQVVLRQLKRI